MPKLEVTTKRFSMSEQERTGWTITSVMYLPDDVDLRSLRLAKKHGDLALWANGVRIPVRLNRVSWVESVTATIYVEYNKLEQFGFDVRWFKEAKLTLEYDVQKALFAPDEMNGVKVKPADPDAGQHANPKDDEEQTEDVPNGKKKSGPKKGSKASRKPRGDTSGLPARA